MSLAEVMRTIEGPVFRIQTNVASDLLTFQRAARHHPAVRQLVGYLSSPDAREQVLNRVLSLSRQSPDPRYENPADTPLSVYLLALSAHDPASARVAAQAIAEARQCWWARTMAENILLERDMASSTGNEAAEIIFGARPPVSVSQTDGPGEAIMIAGLASGTGHRLRLW